MSTETNEQPGTETQATTNTNATNATAAALADLQRDNLALSRQVEEARRQAATAIGERDAFKTQIDQLAPKAKLADELTLENNGYKNRERETKLFEAVRAKAPGGESLALRGTISQLHEQGKINRFAEDATVEAGKVLELLKVEAPSFLRPPTSSGGSPGARPDTSANPVTRNNASLL